MALHSFITKGTKYFRVITAKVTPRGFVNLRVTDKFLTLEDAQKKTKLCNYLWGKTGKQNG